MIAAIVKRQKSVKASKLNGEQQPSVVKTLVEFHLSLFITNHVPVSRSKLTSKGAALLAHTHCSPLTNSQAWCSPAAVCQTMAGAVPACPSLDARERQLTSLQTSFIQFVVRPNPAALIFLSK